ncbi:hypothetical protein EU545_04620 [Candidatus Thorarchaeota archaeon]|nr:MAG: hypothetical protein EU545_04620 [Candidatus Thorarchaeota archaeon]
MSSHISDPVRGEKQAEPGLDYLEKIRDLLGSHEASAAIALDISQAATAMPEAFSPDYANEQVKGLLLSKGPVAQLESFAKTSISWLDRTKKTERVFGDTTAILLQNSDSTRLCLWDRPRGIASFIDVSGVSLEKISVSLLLPLWIAKGEKLDLSDYAPQVTLEERTSHKRAPAEKPTVTRPDSRLEDLVQAVSELESRLDSVPVEDLDRRMTELEDDFDTMHDSLRSGRPASERAGTAYANLEDLIAHLQDTTKRLDKIADNIREMKERLQER